MTTPWAEVPVGGCAGRLLALLALREGGITRCYIAGTLWPETSDDHAQSSLRSALSRLPAPARRAVDVTGRDLSLAAGVEVDLRERRSLAFRRRYRSLIRAEIDLEPTPLLCDLVRDLRPAPA